MWVDDVVIDNAKAVGEGSGNQLVYDSEHGEGSPILEVCFVSLFWDHLHDPNSDVVGSSLEDQ